MWSNLLKKYLYLLVSGICVSLLLISCAPGSNSSGNTWEGNNSTVDSLEDELNAINEEISNHPFFKEQGVEDESVDSSSKQSARAKNFSLTYPRPWFRRITDIDHSYDIDIDGGEADITHNSTIDGVLYVAFDSTSFDTTVEKEFHMRSQRSAHFTRQNHHWRLAQVTLLSACLYDTTASNVAIEELRVSTIAGVSPGDVWAFNNPDILIDFQTGLPIFAPGDLVKVEVTATNPSPGEGLYVFLHTGLSRDEMYDDGTHGDETPMNGIYTRTYTIGNNLGLHFALIDVLSAPTLDNPATDNYKSTVWGIPYHIRDSSLPPDTEAILTFVNNFPLFWTHDTVDIGVSGVAYRHGNEETGVFWGRQARELKHLREIEVDINSTEADIQTVAHFQGMLSIDPDILGFWFGGNPPKRIPFSEAKLRFAHMVKTDGRWELDSISPGNFLPPEEVTSLIPADSFTLQQFQVKKGDVVIWQCDNPRNLLEWDEGYPALNPGEVIKVEVQASGVENFYLFLRYDFFQRDRMYDDGTHGDETPGDGIFTRTYTIGQNYGYHQAAVDLISSQNFDYSDPGNYRSIAASFIYKVVRTSS